jgi:microcystin-dependent protein
MDAFIGEIRLMAIATFTPYGWLLCDGTLYNIQNYQALYAILGPSYGGNGTSTLAVPNLTGRAAVGVGLVTSDGFSPDFAEAGGDAAVTLSASQMPAHTHTVSTALVGPGQRLAAPGGNWIGGLVYMVNANPPRPPFTQVPEFASSASPTSTMDPRTVSPYLGSNGAHENQQPFVTMQYCICWDGYFPTRP